MYFIPRVIGRYLRLIASGLRPHRPVKGEDVMQLGGDCVISADRRLTFIHRSRDPEDRPKVEALLAILAAPK